MRTNDWRKYMLTSVCMTWLLCLCCGMTGCSGQDNVIEAGEPEKSAMDTITLRALVYADQESVDNRYGGKNKFNQGLRGLFDNTTRYWNNSANKFKYYFKFIPTGLNVYPIAEHSAYTKKVGEETLESKYDFIVFFCLDAASNGGSCGGSSGDWDIVWLDKTAKDQDANGGIFLNGVYPTSWGIYCTLAHEIGHYRGAMDLYQYPILPEHNTISQESFPEPQCIMCNSWAKQWSDYASAVFNYTAKWKRLPRDWKSQRFPDGIEITVTKEGKALEGGTVNLYGCRGYGQGKGLPDGSNNPDVYTVPFRTRTTDAKGKAMVEDAEHLYQVKMDGSEPNLPKVLPWSYFFNFLVEAVTPDGAKKIYKWMPDLEVQRQHLDEDNVYYHLEMSF